MHRLIFVLGAILVGTAAIIRFLPSDPAPEGKEPNRSRKSSPAAKSLLPDPAVEVSASIRGRFVNLTTGKAETTTLTPELLWATPDELSAEADALRGALMTKSLTTSQTTAPLPPPVWDRWKHRIVQPLNAPEDWVIWEPGKEPLTLDFTVRDAEKRLQSVHLVTTEKGQVFPANAGTAQAQCRLAPDGAAALVLHGRTGVLLIVPVRWTPRVWAERIGAVVECPPFTPFHIDCEECRRGEAAVKEVRPDLPPREGFRRLYRHVEGGQSYPNTAPHLGRVDSSAGMPSGYLPSVVRFIRAVPPMSEQEALPIAHDSKRWAPFPFEATTSEPITSGWEVWEVQRRGYVVTVWEVQIRPDLPPFGSNSPRGAACEWSRKQAEARLPQLPLTPPNDVTALLVQQLRPEATPHHIALKPTATLWFEADHLGQRFSVPDPAPPGSLEAEGQRARREWAAIWREGRTMVTFGWATADPIGSREISDLQVSKQREAAGRVQIRWLRWLDHRRKEAPPQTERAFWMSEMPGKWAFYIPRDVQTERVPLLFLDAEYEVVTDPPEGLQKAPPFRLRLSASRWVEGPYVGMRSPTISLWCSDPRMQLETFEGRAAVQIPAEPEGVWRLRVMPDRAPQEGQLTITLEGQGKRWQKRMSVTNGDDIPPGWTCPREDGTPLTDHFARFVRLKAGRYTLRVEGTIAWLVQGSAVRPEAVAERKVAWQKTLDLRPSWEKTVIVPLPR